MKKILVLGAGRSAISLIDYLLQFAPSENWKIIVGDMDERLAQRRVKGSPYAEAIGFNANDQEFRRSKIEDCDLVISMLPASMHLEVVKDCITFKKDIITPSYVSEEMRLLDGAAKAAGIIVLNEMGLDPGIDHMSAMQVLDRIRQQGGEMVIFESFAGGLLAPTSDTNPWNYKFTWNPRNVVLAGSGGAVKFRQNHMYKYIPYHKLFRRTEVIQVDGYGKFEGYANRDSLKYRNVYGLDDIPTIYRGTLRRPGFCKAWDVFVQLGMTDDSYMMEGSDQLTHRQFTNSFLAYNPYDSVELKLMHYLKIDQDSDLMEKLKWIGMFEDTPVEIPNGTPAMILQHILEKKWTLNEEDRDMIVMWHKFGFRMGEEDHEINSSVVVVGEDMDHTAMAKTVGLPVGIAARMLMNKKLNQKGIQLPVIPEIYNPVLKELESFNIEFLEKTVPPKFY